MFRRSHLAETTFLIYCLYSFIINYIRQIKYYLIAVIDNDASVLIILTYDSNDCDYGIYLLS